jgi:hypothetical protein
LLAQHVSGLWDERPMLLATDEAGLTAAVAGIVNTGVREFVFVAPRGAVAMSSLPGASCRTVAQTRGPRLHYFDFDIQQCRAASPRRTGRRRR